AQQPEHQEDHEDRPQHDSPSSVSVSLPAPNPWPEHAPTFWGAPRVTANLVHLREMRRDRGHDRLCGPIAAITAAFMGIGVAPPAATRVARQKGIVPASLPSIKEQTWRRPK